MQVAQKSNLSFKKITFSTGNASWRSSSGGSSSSGSSSSSYSSPYRGYSSGGVVNNYGGGGIDPFTFLLLNNMTNNNARSYQATASLSYEETKKAEIEQAKDKLFMQEHPELVKKKKPTLKGVVWGSIATVATALLSRAVEYTKEQKNINFDPPLLAGSALVGLVVGFIVKAANMPNARTERLMQEEKDKKLNSEV